MYRYADPHEINQNIIQYVDNSFKTTKETLIICYCDDDQRNNCTIDTLGPVYSGQTYGLQFIINLYLMIENSTETVVMVSIDVVPTRACKSHSVKSYFQIFVEK